MHPTGVHVHVLRDAIEKLARGLMIIIKNDFIDTTFYGRTLSSFSSVELTYFAIFFLRWPTETCKV